MAKKKQTPPKNDFSFEKDTDICGFSDSTPSDGTCISSFSFEVDSNNDKSIINDTKDDVTFSLVFLVHMVP